MPKIDWKRARNNFAAAYRATGIPLKEWCEQYGFPHNTARKHIKVKEIKLTASQQKIVDERKGKDLLEKEAESQKTLKIQKDKDLCKNPENKKGSNQTHSPEDLSSQEEARSDEVEVEATESKGRRGAPKGNSNARVHGLFTNRFKEIWKVASCLDTDTRAQYHDAVALELIEIRQQFESQLRGELQKLEGRTPSESETKAIEKIEGRIKSCDKRISDALFKAEQIQASGDNRALTRINATRVVADTRRIKVDTQLKQSGIELSKANKAKSEAQTKLANAQLAALDKEGKGENDDLDDILEEIMDQRDGLLSDYDEF